MRLGVNHLENRKNNIGKMNLAKKSKV